MSESPYRWVIVAAGGLLGCVAFHSGEDASARALFEKSLALAREVGFTSQIAWALALMTIL